MNNFQKLIAVSVFAISGAAQAAVVGTYNVSVTGGTASSTQTGTGTASLDDSGSLTMIFATMNQTAPNVGAASFSNVTDVFSGSYAGGTFTATSGVETITGPCTMVNGPLNLCQFTPLPSTVPFGTVSGSVSLAGGTINTSVVNLGQTNTLTYTLTSNAPAVPVPAAAWLFGSGLLGLAGTARRRK